MVINGRGDEYFKPASGLRQGCPLSPYLFVLGMDILSRHLKFLVENQVLKGIKLAKTAPPLTDSLYVDDLLVMGEASTTEARLIMQVLEDFSSVSGQRIGQRESYVWFSRATTDEVRQSVTRIMQVPGDATSPTYLGGPDSNKVGF